MGVNTSLRLNLISQINNPPMMSKQQHLSLLGYFREDFKASFGTFVIKADKNIIHYKGHRFAMTQMLLKSGQT